MNDRTFAFVAFALLLIAAYLLYADWWRQGELDHIGNRLDDLEQKAKARARKPTPPTEAT